MNCRLINFILILCYTISPFVSDGMDVVFEWEEITYGNIGGNGNGGKPNRPSSGDIVFPDRYGMRRNMYKRQTEKITSRNALPKTSVRFSPEPASNTSVYIPYNNVPMGVTHYKDCLFITMPRRRPGIPSTLNCIDLKRDGNQRSPKLYPYPDYETNYLNPITLRPNPNGLVSVYRTTVDECHRLWFICTGMLEYPNNRMQIQRPSIWIIDLKTRRTLKRYEIPEDIVATGRGLASITVDVMPGQCNKAFAYIPDLVNNRLNVYSLEKNRMWSFSHNYFNFDPLAGDLNIAGQSFRWDDGIFSITCGPRDSNGFRQAFFHAMASNNEFAVSTRVLQDEANAARDDHGDDFRLMGSRGVNKQSTMHEFDLNTGVIFYNEIQQNGIGCWNSKNKFSPETHGTVFRDDERMIYPSDMTIDFDGTIWVMSNTMPKFIYSTLEPNKTHFRVWRQNSRDAIRNTICEY